LKIFLDYIPNLETSSWQIEIDKERQHYEDLKSKFIFDPNKANKEEANWIVNNPLSLEEEVITISIIIKQIILLIDNISNFLYF